MSGFNFNQLALAGLCFTGSTAAAGVAIPASNATGAVYVIWNPSGSGVNLLLNKTMLGVATLGTNAVASIGWSFLANAGAGIATGGSVTAGTLVAPRNAIFGYGQASKALFFPATATITAPAFLYALGMAQNATTTQPVAEQAYEHEYNGGLIVPPGGLLSIGGSAAPGSTYQITTTWAEIPV